MEPGKVASHAGIELFCGITDLGDPRNLYAFPQTIYTNFYDSSLISASINTLQAHGYYSLSLLKRTGAAIHRWNWDTNSASAAAAYVASKLMSAAASSRPPSRRLMSPTASARSLMFHLIRNGHPTSVRMKLKLQGQIQTAMVCRISLNMRWAAIQTILRQHRVRRPAGAARISL